MKKFIWSFLGALTLFAACRQYESNLDQPAQEQQDISATDGVSDRTDQPYDFVSNAIEGAYNQTCCTAFFCKYITNPLGNILCGYDYSALSIPPGTFAFLVSTPDANPGNPTVKVRYRLKIDEVNYPPPPPGQIGQGPVTIFDQVIPAGFLPPCQRRSVWINPHIVPNCAKRYNVTLQILKGMPDGTYQVCTSITESNLNLCALEQ